MLRNDFDAHDYINVCALKSDQEIDVGRLALAMSYDDHTEISIDRYVNHLNKLSDEVGRRFVALLEAGSDDDASTRLAALKDVICDQHAYQLDSEYHEILEGADLIRVIDRGKGCSAALCVLYIHAARKQGWDVVGLDFPARFLCRLEYAGERMIFDPSSSCTVMKAHNLRAMVKHVLGDSAELSNAYLNGLDVRQTIVHLFNHLKHRRIEMGEYQQALLMVNRMRILVPNEYRLLLDSGVLCARIGFTERAIKDLRQYVDKAPSYYDREDAMMLLADLETV